MPLHSLTLLVLFAAVTRVLALTPSSNRPHKRHSEGFEVSPEVCICRNWKETYQSGVVSCGAGQEFYFKTKKSSPKSDQLNGAMVGLKASICDEFYETLDHGDCVNLNVGKDKGQWCYVDAECPDLHGGGPVPGTPLSWKLCQPGQDAMFRDFTPEQLYTIAQQDDLDLGLLHKMSYPLSKAWEDKRFPEVQAFWGVGNETGESLPVWLREDMQKIVDTGKPYSFDNSLDERVPHTIVQGMKVWSVEDNEDRNDEHPGTWEQLFCISGCDSDSETETES